MRSRPTTTGSARPSWRGSSRTVVREHHRRLAEVLEASGQADPETLGMHFLGRTCRNGPSPTSPCAADEAAEALAFERAALLYRRALGLQADRPDRGTGPPRGAGRRPGQRRAEARMRPVRTSRSVALAPVAEALELQRRAAMQFLISGHIDEGLAELETVLSRWA